MPHNLVKLAVAARENIGTRHDVLPHVDDANSSDDKHTAPDDEVEDRWMRRLAAILDAPTGENSADAAQLTTDLWIGGRSAAMDVLAANSRGITDLVNICEPWCPLGPNSENIQYVGIQFLAAAQLLISPAPRCLHLVQDTPAPIRWRRSSPAHRACA